MKISALCISIKISNKLQFIDEVNEAVLERRQLKPERKTLNCNDRSGAMRHRGLNEDSATGKEGREMEGESDGLTKRAWQNLKRSTTSWAFLSAQDATRMYRRIFVGKETLIAKEVEENF